jgi:hypothetical protein
MALSLIAFGMYGSCDANEYSAGPITWDDTARTVMLTCLPSVRWPKGPAKPTWGRTAPHAAAVVQATRLERDAALEVEQCLPAAAEILGAPHADARWNGTREVRHARQRVALCVDVGEVLDTDVHDAVQGHVPGLGDRADAEKRGNNRGTQQIRLH